MAEAAFRTFVNEALAATSERRVRVRFEDWPLVWLWPIGLVFMQATFTRVADFDVTLAVILCHPLQLYLLMRYWVRTPSSAQVLVLLGVLAYSFGLGLAAPDPVEFLRSMAHITNLVVMVLLCLNLPIEGRPEVARSIWVLCTLASLAACVVVVQSIAFNVFNDLSVTELLGPYTPPVGLERGPFVPHPLAAVKRANGWFSEPSVAGWFLVLVAAVALAARRLRPVLATSAAVICLTGAVATLSLTGLLASITLVIAYMLFVRDSLRFKLFWAIAGGMGVGAALLVAGHLGILARVSEIDDPGTSIYFRFTAPYTLITDSLAQFPLGYPPGQTEFIEDKAYYENWEGGSQTNIDNTLFLIVFHFGLLGIAFNAAYLLELARLLVQYRRPVGLVMLGVTFSLIATGANWAHMGVMVIGYAIVVGRYLRARTQAFAPRPPVVQVAPLQVPRPLIPRRRAGPRRVGMPRAAPFRVAWQR